MTSHEQSDDEELVEVPREELVSALSTMLQDGMGWIVHANRIRDGWMTGMGLLLDVDYDAGMRALGFFWSWDDGQRFIDYVCRWYELDPADLVDEHLCAGGCGQNVLRINEMAYMATRETWGEAGSPDGCWCIGCLEDRLGRRLDRNDFNWSAPMTNDDGSDRSERLLDRMNAPPSG